MGASKAKKLRMKQGVERLRQADNMFVAMQLRPISYRFPQALKLIVGWDTLWNSQIREEAKRFRLKYREDMKKARVIIRTEQRKRLKRFFSWSFMEHR